MAQWAGAVHLNGLKLRTISFRAVRGVGCDFVLVAHTRIVLVNTQSVKMRDAERSPWPDGRSRARRLRVSSSSNAACWDGHMKMPEVLASTTFGKTTAEEESGGLSSYFVETDQWRRIFAGDIDVVYGPKGSGKSAIYALLLNRRTDLMTRRIIIVPAENPRGTPAFQDLAADPPTDENEFRNLWKLYFLQLIAETLRRQSISPDIAEEVLRPLEEAGLLPRESSLSGYLRAARDYIRRLLNPQSVEGMVEVDQASGLPKGFIGKITFREPTADQRTMGIVSADKLLDVANTALQCSEFNIWLALDRLDVAFADSPELERNALRALFRAYLDLRSFDRISLKIFLRSDIWSRILTEGFREASHITRQVTISWDETSLLNLVVRRALYNSALRDFYRVDEREVLSDSQKQSDLFYRIFPHQVDPGARRPRTLYWILDRTCDGTGYTAPRELIHLLSVARDRQLKQLELGNPEPPDEALFDGSSLKGALPEVSRVRYEQTLCAEFPDLRRFLQALEGEKTLQSPALACTPKTQPI